MLRILTFLKSYKTIVAYVVGILIATAIAAVTYKYYSMKSLISEQQSTIVKQEHTINTQVISIKNLEKGIETQNASIASLGKERDALKTNLGNAYKETKDSRRVTDEKVYSILSSKLDGSCDTSILWAIQKSGELKW